MSNTKCEIISVGTELLLGQIVDTNAAWISDKLSTLGINTYYQQTVGDNYDRMFQAFKIAQSRSNVVIVTGGIGPTEDDQTKQVAAELFGTELYLDQTSMDKIEEYYIERDEFMPESNKKQALVFEGGEVFQNEVGMAPGVHYEFEGVKWFFMPGVPKEMKWLLEEKIIPFFHTKNLIQNQLFSRVLNFHGIGESTLESEIKSIIQSQTNPTVAPLAANGYVTIRLTASADSLEVADEMLNDIEKEIMLLVGDYFTGYGHVPLDQLVLNVFEDHGLTLSACESLTGGLFSSTMVSNPGASNVFKGSYVSYTNEVKNEVVGVPLEILENDGAVSEKCAISMAENTNKKLGSDLAISFTGVAGEDSIDGHEPGTVYIGLSIKGKSPLVEKLQLKGSRKAIREEAVLQGLKIILNTLDMQFKAK
ncbi:competence/damage-inducible protein A [Halalkalibacillus sediminis]|uniref:Putative competence-damage inducible protein n=1 Tax=Halalkalibacillus sediminis TaxID=2018042 RepID=A0A2I0QWF9_9BACI|nr:competence/damage-inducible protein A [Halalkalibacillus sediminis]PKR78687.1 competence/damage-inducible protein A [Halalkalibacillus sediminis]